ncbi:AI-2E family transporter [Schaalia sp. ZJ1691]|uniref:AI-2E family transporter n=1 Tax=Schaalia sp. ZJ1691 TaxID=2709404 RepID=UPI0013ED2785|nr:AI-2E family transporter [Schaalia sp. ZJ1691]
MSGETARAKWNLVQVFDRFVSQLSDRGSQGIQEEVSFREGPETPHGDAGTAVPWTLRVAAAFSWRVIVVAVAAVGIVWAGMQLSMVIMPVAVALLLAVLLEPFVGWMVRKLHLPRTLAAVLGLLSTLVLLVAALSQAGNEIFQQMPRLFNRTTDGIQKFVTWIQEGPLKLDSGFIDNGLKTAQEEITQWAQSNSSTLASGALSVTSSVAGVLSSTLIVLFCLFFFLKDGRRIWLWVVRLFPAPARVPLHESAIRGWVTLGSYVRTQIQVAAIDAIGIGLGAFFLGLPMVIPIVVVVFFASFIPIIGALVSGAMVVFVALVDQGLTAGIIMLVIILAVQQVESNILQPLLMSHAVSLHPMAVLLVVTAGGSIAGIPGAIFGVPIAAFINATFLYLHGYDPMPDLQTDQRRPGGAPGLLEEMVSATYGTKEHQVAASEAHDGAESANNAHADNAADTQSSMSSDTSGLGASHDAEPGSSSDASSSASQPTGETAGSSSAANGASSDEPESPTR